MSGNRYYIIPQPQENAIDFSLKFLSLICDTALESKSVFPPDILLHYGGKKVILKKDDFIFQEGDEALFYFELISGSLKMVTYSEDGDEFIQGIFSPGESFGEPPLFAEFKYPSAAVALSPAEIWKLPKENFFRLLKENFELHLALNKILCERLRFKNMILSEISFYDPEHRIKSLLNYLKEKMGKDSEKFTVPLTRQQIADMSGLRVETVIRTVKTMEEQGKLTLKEHKILI